MEAVAREEAKKPKREEWMLVPPKDEDWSSRVDPTKLRNRKFNTGKGAKAPAQKSGGVSSIWTETPEEKRQRLADEVMGVRKPASEEQPMAIKAVKDEGTARRIRGYNVSLARFCLIFSRHGARGTNKKPMAAGKKPQQVTL
jgi:hypothetical protein